MLKTLCVFGTRPEAVKLCPVILHLRQRPTEFSVRVCVTAQHRSMLDQVLGAFGVVPDHDLNLMEPNQTLAGLTGRTVAALGGVLRAETPDVVIVQGDTTTTLCGALAAFYERVPVAHVEAGLRTGDMSQPFPEEMNRVVTTRLATLHLAATDGAATHLKREGVPDRQIWVTGQSGIDAVLYVRDKLREGTLQGPSWENLIPGRKLVVVTAHRRESFGPAFESLCRGIAEIASRSDVQVVYPVHRNPNVTDPVFRILGGMKNVLLIDPLDYVPFVDLMQRADLLITDSGGVQEEGPSLGKPILVMREKTERPEAVAAGTVKLVGTDGARIAREAAALLDDDGERARMSRVHNPYGDGHASERIAHAMLSFFGN